MSSFCHNIWYASYLSKTGWKKINKEKQIEEVSEKAGMYKIDYELQLEVQNDCPDEIE